MSKQVSNVCGWDFTLAKSEDTYSDVIAELKMNCKKYTFSEEIGEGGYEHFQGRVSLKLKTRTCHKLGWVMNFHWSVTSNANVDNVFYIEKSESHVAGPWSDKDLYVPRHLRSELRGWQKELRTMVTNHKEMMDDRHIICIVEETGCVGKSYFANWMGCHGYASVIPPMNDMKDIMRCAYDITDVCDINCFITDIPRGKAQKKLQDFYCGIETVKDGYVYDDRYGFKFKWIDSPVIVVFSNTYPEQFMLSADRWLIFNIIDNCLLRRP